MTNQNWKNLIEEKREELIESGIVAYRDAMENKHLQFTVELHEDGEVTTLQDVAGGNSISQTTFKGTSVEIIRFCFQCYDPVITDYELIEKLKEHGKTEMIDVLVERAEEEFETLEYIMNEDESLRDLVSECYEDTKKFEIEEYAHPASDKQIDRALESFE